MKKIFCLTIFVCLGFSGLVQAETGSLSVQQQIQPLLSQMASAAKAHDTDRFMAAYLHQPGLVFVFDGKVIRGWDALRKQQLEWWHNGKTDVIYTQQGPTGFKQLDAGIVVTTQSLTSRRTSPDGKVRTGSFTVTDVWQKLPQGWRIVYGHESWAR